MEPRIQLSRRPFSGTSMRKVPANADRRWTCQCVVLYSNRVNAPVRLLKEANIWRSCNTTCAAQTGPEKRKAAKRIIRPHKIFKQLPVNTQRIEYTLCGRYRCIKCNIMVAKSKYFHLFSFLSYIYDLLKISFPYYLRYTQGNGPHNVKLTSILTRHSNWNR